MEEWKEEAVAKKYRNVRNWIYKNLIQSCVKLLSPIPKHLPEEQAVQTQLHRLSQRGNKTKQTTEIIITAHLFTNLLQPNQNINTKIK